MLSSKATQTRLHLNTQLNITEISRIHSGTIACEWDLSDVHLAVFVCMCVCGGENVMVGTSVESTQVLLGMAVEILHAGWPCGRVEHIVLLVPGGLVVRRQLALYV